VPPVPAKAGKEDEAVVILQAVHVRALGEGWGQCSCQGKRSNIAYSAFAHLVPHSVRCRHAFNQWNGPGESEAPLKAFQTSQLVTFHFQLNFSDHQKIILCPLMQAVTLLDVDKNFRTYPFTSIVENGCTNELYQKLRYAHEKLVKLIEKISTECF
jgi:hypothetical protein